MMIMTPSSASPPLPNSPPANHHHIHGSHGSAVGSSHHRVPSPSTSAADRPPQPERMNAHPMDAVKGPSLSLTHQQQSRQQQQQSSSSSGRSHRERYGRRPSNYTASYTPPAALVQTAANARAAREADDEQERQERIRDNTAGSHGSSHGHGHGHGSRSRRSNQHSNSHSNSHSYSAASPPRTNNNNNSNPNHNHSSAHSHSSHSTKSNSKQELTEQQIAEYAGKRALMRLEQEFTAEQKALSPLSHQNHHCNNNNNKSNNALYNTMSTSSRSIVSNTSSMASSSSNTNTNNYHSHHKSKVISVMDRKKLARVPQVNKRDLAIGEYLGRGNFCDVFEVTWVLPGGDVNSSDNDYHDDGSHSQYSDDYDGHCKKMEALSLSCSNDLRPVFDLGQRRSISQINTSLQNRYQVRVTSSSTGRNNNSNTVRVGREVYTIGTTIGGGAGDAMTMNATPNTSSRSTLRNPNILALKCLRPAVRAQPRKFVIGAEDLAHETALLACLDHPNIIQLYGRAEGCFSTAFHFGTNTNTSPTNNNSNNSNSKEKAMYHEGYFIILDRLMATLTERIDEWQNECRTINGAAPITTNTTMPEETIRMNIAETTLREHLYKRLKVAYCIADALEYLHSRHVVFRDLKPANVGFDCNDCVKMFDFGFATSIAPLLNQPTQHDQGGYGPLTETCGTRRYMAPEVALKLGYGKEVDVYSFGMLLWEICALEKPFDSIKSVDAFHDMVVLCGKRPSLHIDPLWTTSLKNLMSRCWSTDPLDRPTMVQVKSMLCNVLRDMNVSEMESKMRSAGAVAGNGNSASGIARGGAGEARGGGGRKGEGSQVPSQQQQQQQHPQGGPPMHFFNKMRRRVTM